MQVKTKQSPSRCSGHPKQLEAVTCNEGRTLLGANTSVGRLASWITLATMKVLPCDHTAHTTVPRFDKTGGMAHQQIVNGRGALRMGAALKDGHWGKKASATGRTPPLNNE